MPSREELIRKLQQLARELGRSPTIADLEAADGYPGPSDYLAEFGWWNDAKRAAGLATYQGGEGTPSRPGPDPEYGRDELLDHLRDLEEQVDGKARKSDMADMDGAPSPATYRRRFGSWNAAREQAGLDPITGETYTDEELLGFLREKADEIDHRPVRRRDIAEDDALPHPSIYNRRFGSFRAAKDAAGID